MILVDSSVWIDVIIATRCIENGYSLLCSDRDFNPFVTHLGLRAA